MWNNTSKLWGNTSTNIGDSTDFILTEQSQRIKTPQQSAIQLWPHQEAMLYRINTIETAGYLCQTQHTEASIARYMDKRDTPKEHQVCLGVMNDPPGSGKTYAILTHILMDQRARGPSIIIVPQNIYAQWRQSIELVFKHHLSKCLFSMSYADVMAVYGNPQQVNYYKIILLQDSFAEAYLKVLNDNDIGVHRIVIDEVDIMDKFVCSSVKTNFVWLMSASYRDQKRLGPYHIGDHKRVICKCDEGFVKKSLNIPDPLNRIIKCDDEHVQIFKDVLEENQLRALNAGDHNSINRLMNKSGLVVPASYKETAAHYADYLYRKTDILEEMEEQLQHTPLRSDDGGASEKARNILIDKINGLKRIRRSANILKGRIDSTPDLAALDYKEKYLQDEFLAAMKSGKTKWLFFNDNSNVLIKYQEFLQTHGIKSEMLDGGNQRQIEKTLAAYKDGETQVLLLNSMIEGAGMNLENTTHLVFMHKTQEKFIEQVVGRAQRYGRKGPLNIIMLFNKHE
jgi:hypothetical protein